jgi:hypothetical protein
MSDESGSCSCFSSCLRGSSVSIRIYWQLEATFCLGSQFGPLQVSPSKPSHFRPSASRIAPDSR